MKKILPVVLLLLLLKILPCKAQFVTLADQDFASWLNQRFQGCFDQSDLRFDTTCSEVLSLQELTIDGFLDDIENLDGLQYFKSLRTLNITGVNTGSTTLNSISSIPRLPNSLKAFLCSNTVITTLPPMPDTLISISLNNNALLNTISPLPAQLQNLQVNNSPATFSTLPGTLKYLQFANLLSPTVVPVLPNELKYLESISFGDVSFSQSVFPDSLRHLAVEATNILSYPILNDSLSFVYVTSRVLNYINSFPANLDSIVASGSGISNLPGLPAELNYLDVRTTGMICLPYLPNRLSKLYLPLSILCLPNTVVGLQVFRQSTPINLSLCSPVNNANHCPSGPVITGTFFFDNNSNGIRDANENFRSGIAVSHSNGNMAYSNSIGYFEISGILGNNSVSITPPPFYNAVPDFSTFQFNNNDTIVSTSYALQPSVTADSIAIHVVPDVRAKPGFNHRARVIIYNIGTTTVSPSVTLRYNSSYLSFLGSQPSGAVNNGNLLTIAVSALSPGEIQNLSFNFNVNVGAAIGDSIYFVSTALAGSSVSADNAYSIIRAAFDPNDKNATPVLTPQQVMDGDWINYLIRFQNTGNDTAINVVVTDTLDTNLEPSSFEIIGSSHPAIIQRKGRNLSFEFYNIMLPDSNINILESQGYIRFRVKALSSIAIGNIIPNYANIYFDYNVPVTTNTTTTKIEASVVPLTLLSFKALYIGNNEVILSWKTSEEFNTGFFEIEVSDDGRSFHNLGVINAQGSGSNSYSFKAFMTNNLQYYRLKMIDLDGSFTYSETRRVSLKDANGLVVNPNPSSGNFEVIFYSSRNDKAALYLYDVNGRIVWRQSCNVKAGVNTIPVHVGWLAAGFYMIRFEGSVTLQTKVIID